MKTCPKCDGKGSMPCTKCDGTNRLDNGRECPRCTHGVFSYISTGNVKCNRCHGSGEVKGN